MFAIIKNNETEKIKEKIKGHRIVSFDMYDTLIKRDVAKPTDLFYAVGEYVREGNRHFFWQERVDAEKKVRKEKGEGTTLADIYSEMAKKGVTEENVSYIEQEMEMSAAVPEKDMREVFNWCKGEGYSIVITTDMYLPGTILERILTRCGITGYDKMYVSCENGVSKRTGDAYRTIQEDYGASPQEIIHIGDNRISDFEKAIEAGLDCILIENGETKAFLPKKDDDSYERRTLSAIAANHCQGMSAPKRTGFYTFGPILYGFSQWLEKRIREDGIEKVFFLSRDGYMLQKAWSIVTKSEVENHYVYCSRRAITVPLLWKHPDLDTLNKYITFYSVVSLRFFLSALGLKYEAYIQSAKEFNLDMDFSASYSDFIQDSRIVSFYEKIKVNVIKNSRIEYDAVMAYLKSLEPGGNIAVVDIGYNGTMQKALLEYLKEIDTGSRVTGYYVVLKPDSSIIRNNEIKAYGYFNDEYSHEREIFRDIKTFTPIFESCFLAPHGSVLHFQKMNQDVEPVFQEYEYDSQFGQRCDERKIIGDFQDGAIECVKTIIKSQLIPSIDVSDAINSFMRMGLNPSFEEIQLWGDLRFFDHGTMYIAAPRSLLFYLFHFNTLKIDWKACKWRQAFLKRMTGLDVNFFKILSFTRRLRSLQ